MAYERDIETWLISTPASFREAMKARKLATVDTCVVSYTRS
jgi:hypothetical protein